jgi:RNA polymerase sigma-70 factor (ECF subfamily)
MTRGSEKPPDVAAGAHGALSERQQTLLTELWEEHYEAIFLFVSARVTDHNLAEDIASTAFVQALQWVAKNGELPAGRANYRGWLKTIARNALVTWHRRTLVRGGLPRGGTDDPEGSPPCPDVPDPRTVSPSSNMENEDQLFALRECLEELAEDTRRLVLQRYLHGSSFKELVAMTGAPQGTVAVRLHRAVRRVRDCVEVRMVG